jgi:glycosyltransferase involved in cell wall biosynthesis
MKNPLVSVFIAAYNNPEYTKKTIRSIVQQNYRPIEVILCDDCSPINLKYLIEEYDGSKSDDLLFKYFRHAKNILGMDNMIFGFDQCSGKYGVNIQHDDWWIDPNFLKESVEIMELQDKCYLCIGNSAEEGLTSDKIVNFPDKLFKNKWCLLNGGQYIQMLGIDFIGHPAWSGVIFNILELKKLGFFLQQILSQCAMSS